MGRRLLDELDIEVMPGELELYNRSVQPAGCTIKEFRLGRTQPMPKALSARYNTPGEPFTALTEIGAVWLSTEPEIAENYMTPWW